MALSVLPMAGQATGPMGPPSQQTGAKVGDGLSMGNRDLAEGLADYARQSGDTRAMIVAARILGTMTDPTDKRALTRSAALAEARFLAKGDPDLLAEIAGEAASESKGCIGCGAPIQLTVTLGPRETWTQTFTARGGKPLIAGAKASPRDAVALVLLDENGSRICRDDIDKGEEGDIIACRFNPLWTGPYQIQLINKSDGEAAVKVVAQL